MTCESCSQILHLEKSNECKCCLGMFEKIPCFVENICKQFSKYIQMDSKDFKLEIPIRALTESAGSFCQNAEQVQKIKKAYFSKVVELLEKGIFKTHDENVHLN